MTRTISLITVLGAALVLAVPAAWGNQPVYQQNGSGDSANASQLPRGAALGGGPEFLRGTALESVLTGATQEGLLRGDDHVTTPSSQPLDDMVDAGARAAAIGRTVVEPVATGGFMTGDDHVTSVPADVPVSSPVTSSGREIEWPQVGIGVGIGALLAVGLLLAVRYTRPRPLAH